MERDEIESDIRAAFAGVQLGSGVSLQQARLADERRYDMGEAEFAAVRRLETTDDWTRIPDDELARDNIAHLDAEGLRYYLPALMLWLLDHYDDEDVGMDDAISMTAIGTIGAIAPYEGEDEDIHWWRLFAGFTREQETVIASYVEALPRLIELRSDDAIVLSRAFDRHWRQYLASS